MAFDDSAGLRVHFNIDRQPEAVLATRIDHTFEGVRSGLIADFQFASEGTF
jgi:hypothetical protein